MHIERISFHLPRLFSDAMKTIDQLRAHEKPGWNSCLI